MFFMIPTKIYIEENTLLKNEDQITKYKNALIVTGRNSAKKSGVLDDLLPILKKHDVSYTIFDEITENPDTDSIEKAKNHFLQTNTKESLMIAIGGGSPIDAAKAISLAITNDLNKDNIYDSNLHKKAMPIIAIPTTSGTGSEVTQYSVLNDKQKNTKAGFGSELIFPKIAFCDPKYTISLNHTVTRDTAIDALSHLLEGIYSNRYNEFLMPIIIAGIKLIYENLHKCLDNPDNLAYRAALMLAANYGGIVIAHTSTTLQHSIGYPLTTEFNTSHGLANGIVMKQMMNLYEPFLNGKLDIVFNHLKISKTQLFAWIDSLNMKFEGNINHDFIEKRIPEVMNSRNMTLNPTQIKPEQVIQIYKSL